jgi:iron complex outermembrane receptor protein
MAVVRGLVAVSIGGLLGATSLHAQQAARGTVTGRVVDSTSQQPLSNVTVRVEGTPVGSLTRDDGTFTLAGVPAGAQTLRATRVGFASKAQPVTVTSGGTVNAVFQLRVLATQLTEVVTVGYGTQRREAVTAAVSSVNADEAKVGVQPNVNNLIQGRAAGVQVVQNSGDPGAGAQIRVRGGASVSANNEPLYVVDGVPIQNEAATVSSIAPGASVSSRPLPSEANAGAATRSPLNTINPNDIAEITVLKDAAATAIYGSRAANGVVLITTKRGVAGTSTVDYDGFFGLASQARTYDVLSAGEYRDYYQRQLQAGAVGFTQAGLTALGTSDTDWQDAVNRTARLQSHNLAFSGGSNATTYRASVNYFDNPGIVIGSGLNRVQGRLNGQSRLLGDKLTINLNLTSAQTRDQYLTAENTGGFAGGVFINSIGFLPTRPVYASGDSTSPFFNRRSPYYEYPGTLDIRNPLGLAQQINDRATTNRTLGNLQAQYALFNGLTASLNVGIDRTTGTRSTYVPSSSPLGQLYTSPAGLNGAARLGDRNLQGATIQSLLTYDRPLGASQTLNVVGGYEYQRFSTSEFTTGGTGFITDASGANNLGAASQTVQPFSFLERRNQLGLFARANYGFRDRYFITGVIRRDGSSVFGANNKYAVFPGASVSWRISQESFAKALPFNDLRLRASYGLQGNQAIRPYQTLALLGTDPNNRYPFGSVLVTGVLPTQNANPNLRWETTAQAGVGLDFGLFENRLTGTVDYYSKTTRDLLFLTPVPQPAVVSTQIQNIGRLKNAGFEGSLDYQAYNAPQRTVSFGVVFTADRNRVVSLGTQEQIFTGRGSGRGQSATNAQIVKPGLPLGSFYAPISVGVDGNGNELFARFDSTGARTGTTTNPSASTDYQIVGNANPTYTVGLRNATTWGRFNGSFLIRAQGGNKIFNNTAAVYATKAAANQSQNFLRTALDDGINYQNSNVFSSRFIEDGDFIRLQNVTIGYNVPISGLVRRVTSMNIYVSGDNLLLGTSYSGLDPEVNTAADVNGIPSRGIDYLSYPRARTFTFGTRFGF